MDIRQQEFEVEALLRSHSTKTSATLLMEVRDSDNAEAWAQFESRYREMLARFCRSRGVQHADSEDIIQIVFAKLLLGLKGFEYDPAKGRFRDYLYRCVRSALSDWLARPSVAKSSVVSPEGVVDGETSDAAFEREWMDHHYRKALDAVCQRVDPGSIAVLEATIAGRSVPDIAANLGMTEQGVYKVQQRMRQYLKEEIARQVREEDGGCG